MHLTTVKIFSIQASNPGLLQVDSLLAETQGKPKNTGVGSLSVLQQIFSTQELNRGLLHCRWILDQLSYQGSPAPATPNQRGTLTYGVNVSGSATPPQQGSMSQGRSEVNSPL